MATYSSIIRIRGAIDDLGFRQTEFGNEVGLKPGPTREQVLSRASFRRTRLNAQEFQGATADGQMIRNALKPLLTGVKGSSLNGRMNAAMYSIARTDGRHELGYRRSAYGDVSLLNGFEFNKDLPLSYGVPVAEDRRFDVHAGACSLMVPRFIARKRKELPAGATHYRLVSVMVVIDLKGKSYRRCQQETLLLRLGKLSPDDFGFQHQLPVRAGEVMIQLLCMEFFLIDNGWQVQVKGSLMQVLEAGRCEHKEGNSVKQDGKDVVAPGSRSNVADEPWFGEHVQDLKKVMKRRGIRTGTISRALLRAPA